MKRDYETGTADSITFFTGVEVEKTPAFGMKTLFVTGIQNGDDIMHHYTREKCTHIFFGANHSFDPGLDFPKDADNWEDWEKLIGYFLKEDILCSLDIPIQYAQAFLDSGLVEYDNFIPQLRIPVPYAKLWNYNTMVKIDDVDFKASNPGVWCHSLHDLMDRDKFTDWSKYGLDKVLK